MATALTKRVVREARTRRGNRIVELTPHGVVVREKGRRTVPPPVPIEAIEDMGLKLAAAARGHRVPRPRGRP